MSALAPTRPIADHVTEEARRRAMANHPCCAGRPSVSASPGGPAEAIDDTEVIVGDILTDESGSMATEYGLIMVVAAVICSLLIKWASDGGIFGLLASIIEKVAGFLF